MNRKNLKLLADFLAESPIEPHSFDMSTYHEDYILPLRVLEDTQLYGVNYCGSAGCAIGWAPAVPGIDEPLPHEYFNAYSLRVFDLDSAKTPEWLWMFYGTWNKIDNTARGAAARIYALLDNPSIVENVTRRRAVVVLPRTTKSYDKYLLPLLD